MVYRSLTQTPIEPKEGGTQRERWQISGAASEIYERYIVPAVFGPWAPVLIKLAETKPRQHILDVACGTGVVARKAAELVGTGGKVIGLDLNPGMLNVARLLPPVSGATIEWREADATSLPFEKQTFDVVFCQLGLQYFTDRARALHEMHRVLVPHGRLAAMVWRDIKYSPGFEEVAKALEKHVSVDAAKIMHAPFSLGDAEELRRLITNAGFKEVLIKLAIGTVRFPSPEEFVESYVAASPIAAHVANVNDEARKALIQAVKTAIQNYVDDFGIAFPIEANLAVAYA